MNDPQLDAALIRAEASHALAVAGCANIELLLPHVEQRLVRGPDGEVAVMDDDGALRQGCTPAQLAREVRERYDRGPNRGKYFR